ncbi:MULTISPECIES: recombinase family protein [unclassified Streptomyces]|uniref:recombinase family protein n=1 Tax=unclassified Streptomyces TaxID=2593676 RepID=UPI00380BD648
MYDALDTTTPGGRLIFHVFAALAEFIRGLIVAGTKEGLAAARGKSGARPTVSSTTTSSARPATCPPTPGTASPPSPRSSASPWERCTTTSPASGSYGTPSCRFG